MIITPAILAKNEKDFREHLQYAHQLPCGRWHIDVLDGSRHNATCWHNANVVRDMPDLPEIELHLMVHDPLAHISAWHRAVPMLRRVLIEADGHNVIRALIHANILKLERSLVLNPGTMPDVCEAYAKDVDELVIMGVVPGKSGQTFLGDPVFATIARARALFPTHDIAIDGGVNEKNIGKLAHAGVLRTICASALWESPLPSSAHLDLQEAAKIVL